jgi:hypothetical protein
VAARVAIADQLDDEVRRATVHPRTTAGLSLAMLTASTCAPLRVGALEIYYRADGTVV